MILPLGRFNENDKFENLKHEVKYYIRFDLVKRILM